MQPPLKLDTSRQPAPQPVPSAHAPERPRVRRPRWLVSVSVALAALLLYLAVRGVDWGTFWLTLRHGRYAFLLAVIPVASANYLIRAARWRLLVGAERRMAVVDVFWANMVGYMGNAYLPARAGELLRSSFLGRRTGAGTSFVLATALSERLLDLNAVVLIGAASLLTQPLVSSLFASSLRLLALAGAAGLLVVLTAPFFGAQIVGIMLDMPLPDKISAALTTQAERFLLGMRSLHSGRRLAGFLALTLVIWLVDATAVVIGVRFVSQTLDLAQGLVLVAALGLSSAVPSTPGYVGVYQFIAVAVLTPFGFSRADSLAYIIAAQLTSYVVVTFWGLLGLWQINRAVQPR